MMWCDHERAAQMANSSDEREDSPDEREHWSDNRARARGLLWQRGRRPTGLPIFGWALCSTVIMMAMLAWSPATVRVLSVDPNMGGHGAVMNNQTMPPLYGTPPVGWYVTDGSHLATPHGHFSQPRPAD
jgi:hypothetical protein